MHDRGRALRPRPCLRTPHCAPERTLYNVTLVPIVYTLPFSLGCSTLDASWIYSSTITTCYLLVRVPVRPEHDRAQSCAIALRSPASEKPSELKRNSPDMHPHRYSPDMHAVVQTRSPAAKPPRTWTKTTRKRAQEACPAVARGSSDRGLWAGGSAASPRFAEHITLVAGCGSCVRYRSTPSSGSCLSPAQKL